MSQPSVKLSANFKSQTRKAILALVFFIISYTLILLISMGLTLVCIVGALKLVTAHPSFFTLIIGLGIGSIGILVFVFLIKFIFQAHKTDHSHLIEIKREEEPKLFKLIDEIVEEVKTKFPKKVFLSAEVNAGVFYNSSFWSMFFPVRKNLQIGLGLVNTVTDMELKAILAHEFGHFSQKTLKVGSYVYNVNQVIFNMIFENESYEKALSSWASLSSITYIFARFTNFIIIGIQNILKELYEVVNKSYLGLSREMEFHADEIAASVTGHQALKTSLLRLSLSDFSFHSLLNYYQTRFSENLKSQNIYKEHFYLVQFFAKESDVEILNQLPQVKMDELEKFNKSKLVISDQWASHPTVKERVEKLIQTGFDSEEKSPVLAGELFINLEKNQELFTEKIFKEVAFEGEVRSLNLDEFIEDYQRDFLKASLPKVYQGYYDNKGILPFELNQSFEDSKSIQMDELFSKVKIDLVYNSLSLMDDIETIKAIERKEIPIKTFDYDGKKYNRKQAKTLLGGLEEEKLKLEKKIQHNDIKIYAFFKVLENSSLDAPHLNHLYQNLFDFEKNIEPQKEISHSMLQALSFINQQTPFDEIRRNFKNIQGLENRLKKGIKEVLDDPNYKSELNSEIEENFKQYISKNWTYFGSESYFDPALEVLFKAIHNYAYMLERGEFVCKKKLLSYQESLLLVT